MDRETEKYEAAFNDEMKTINRIEEDEETSIEWLNMRKANLEWLLIDTRARLRAINKEINKRG